MFETPETSMINLLLRLAITMIAIKGADFLLPNFNLHGTWKSWLVFSIAVGLLNWVVKPILVFFSFPFVILTMGLFYLVINAVILYIASLLVPGVLSATMGGIVAGGFIIAILNWFLSAVFRVKKKE
jgi:putative membrane protein